MTPAQCRAARALIGMTQDQLAGLAVVTTSLIADYESRAIAMRVTDVEAIWRALEKAGVEFIDGDRPGVRLRKGSR
jgi:predicted transcriptional regulator